MRLRAWIARVGHGFEIVHGGVRTRAINFRPRGVGRADDPNPERTSLRLFQTAEHRNDGLPAEAVPSHERRDPVPLLSRPGGR
jgi:hypothetical protein